MRKLLIPTLFFGIAILLLNSLSAQTITAPEKYTPGQMFVVQITDIEPGSSVLWDIEARTFDIVTYEDTNGVALVVDTPSAYRGSVTVEADCLSIVGDPPAIKVVRLQKTLTSVVDTPPDDDDDVFNPPPDDDDPVVGEYDGPNEFEVGEISYENAPGYDAGVVSIMRSAADSLYGRPDGKTRFIFIENQAQNQTEDNVHVWIRNRLTQSNPSTEWVRWYEACYTRIKFLTDSSGLTKRETYDVFLEMAAGVEAKK